MLPVSFCLRQKLQTIKISKPVKCEQSNVTFEKALDLHQNIYE